MSVDRYASVPERITWTTGFRGLGTDKAVLGTLSTFANFKTGAHANMALTTLIKRAKMPRRTVIRSLKRLEEDGWISATRRHRRATVYNIHVERLSETWTQPVALPPRFECHGGTQGAEVRAPLSATVAPKHSFECHGGTQDAVLSATVAPQSPVRSDPLLVRDHKEPALRAVPTDDSDTTPTTTEAKVVARSPQQLTFGPADVSPPTHDPNWRLRFAETLRSALGLGHVAERKKHG